MIELLGLRLHILTGLSLPQEGHVDVKMMSTFP